MIKKSKSSFIMDTIGILIISSIVTMIFVLFAVSIRHDMHIGKPDIISKVIDYNGHKVMVVAYSQGTANTYEVVVLPNNATEIPLHVAINCQDIDDAYKASQELVEKQTK